MSAQALQRVVVRMLYDPALVTRVYADPAAALPEVPLTPTERAWLTAPDVRRWRADPLRRTRSLHALLAEYPVSAALVITEGGGLPALDAYFSSPAFHACIQDRGTLALDFGRWLAREPGSDLAAAARIERAIARARRAPPRRACEPLTPAATLTTAADLDAFSIPAGGLARYLACRTVVGADPAQLLAPSLCLPPPGADTPLTGVLVEQTPTGPTVEEIPEALLGLLRWCATPRRLPAALAWLAPHGLDAAEATELLSELCAAGTLQAG